MMYFHLPNFQTKNTPLPETANVYYYYFFAVFYCALPLWNKCFWGPLPRIEASMKQCNEAQKTMRGVASHASNKGNKAESFLFWGVQRMLPKSGNQQVRPLNAVGLEKGMSQKVWAHSVNAVRTEKWCLKSENHPIRFRSAFGMKSTCEFCWKGKKNISKSVCQQAHSAKAVSTEKWCLKSENHKTRFLNAGWMEKGCLKKRCNQEGPFLAEVGMEKGCLAENQQAHFLTGVGMDKEGWVAKPKNTLWMWLDCKPDCDNNIKKFHYMNVGRHFDFKFM